MAKLWVTEFTRYLSTAAGGVPAAWEPRAANQVVDYSGGETDSAAFDAETILVRIHTDADCHVEFGAAPTASSSTRRLVAGQTEYFAVPRGQSFKVSAISA